MRERPLEQSVEFARQYFYVDGHVRVLARPVAVQEHGRLQLVSELAGVERRADEFQPVAARLVPTLFEFVRHVADFPDQRAYM